MREHHGAHQSDPPCQPRRSQMGERVEDAHHEKQKPQSLFIHAEALKEPISQQRIRQKSAPGGIHREKHGDPPHNALGRGRDGAYQPRLQLRRCARFHLRIQQQIKRRARQIQPGVQKEYPPIRWQQAHASPASDGDGQTSGQGPQRARSIEHHVVPGKRPGAVSVGHQPGDDRLLHRECRAAVGAHAVEHGKERQRYEAVGSMNEGQADSAS